MVQKHFSIVCILFIVLALPYPNLSSNSSFIDNSYGIEKRLIHFKYKKYINKPIDQLLKGIDMKYNRIIFVRMKPLYLSFVTIVYSGEIHLDIYTEEYKYLRREINENESYEYVWKVEDLLKERVSKIRVRRSISGKSLKEYPKKPILPVV